MFYVYLLTGRNNPPPEPRITATKYFLRGETFSMNCTVPHQNEPISLGWRTPHLPSNEVIALSSIFLTLEERKMLLYVLVSIE